MPEPIAQLLVHQAGDSIEFLERARAIILGVTRQHQPARLHLIRIDNWFGPKWLHFAGKALGALGIHSSTLHVPPFVPHRVVSEQTFVGPTFDVSLATHPLHIDTPSIRALRRRISDIDQDAVFVWFSGQSEQNRGAIMVYSPASDEVPERPSSLRGAGAFYAGFAQDEAGWNLVQLRGLSRGEVQHLEQAGLGPADQST